MHAYIHTCIHTYIRASIHTYINTYMHKHIHTPTHIHTYIYMCVCVCVYIYIYICTQYFLISCNTVFLKSWGNPKIPQFLEHEFSLLHSHKTKPCPCPKFHKFYVLLKSVCSVWISKQQLFPYTELTDWFVGAFAKLRKAAMSSVMSVRLSAPNNSSPTGRIFVLFDIFLELKMF
jgi:hypothetical protein